MSDWQPIKLVEDHPDTARITHALYLSGAYETVMLRGRFYIGDEEDESGCPTVYRETGDDEDGGEDEVMGLAVPGGNGGWHLGCTTCRAKLTRPGAGKCPAC